MSVVAECWSCDSQRNNDGTGVTYVFTKGAPEVLTHAYSYLLTHSLTRSLTYSLTHYSLTYSLTHYSLTYSLVLTYSLLTCLLML